MKYVSALEKIQSVEKLDDFIDEYVYDIEMEDKSHTFIANNILVHNSVYVCFDYALQSVEGLSLDNKKSLEFCLALNRHRLNDYFKQAFEKYATHFNTDNSPNFEL